jgi:hypothetical protein
LILRDDKGSRSRSGTRDTSLESSELSSGRRSATEVREAEELFANCGRAKSVDRFVASYQDDDEGESQLTSESNTRERRLTRTNSRFGEFVKSRVAISLDLVGLSERSSVTVHLRPVDIDERASLDRDRAGSGRTSELNRRLSLTNESSDGRIETECFVDVVLLTQERHTE